MDQEKELVVENLCPNCENTNCENTNDEGSVPTKIGNILNDSLKFSMIIDKHLPIICVFNIFGVV
jgi:hypothetical protein